METLKLQTTETVSAETAENLEVVQRKFGFIPNLFATFANSPHYLSGYLHLSAAFDKSDFTRMEKQVILLTASVENGCLYCIAGYSTALKKMQMDEDTIWAIRTRHPLEDKKLDTLVVTTRRLMSEKGNISPASIEQFIQAGYDKLSLLDILTAIAMKTMANYLDNLFPIPIDKEYDFEANAELGLFDQTFD